MSDNAGSPLVEVDNLSVKFVSREATVYAVNSVSFTAHRGEVLCILGESGSGKSVTLRTLMRLLPRSAHAARIAPANDGACQKQRKLCDPL